MHQLKKNRNILEVISVFLLNFIGFYLKKSKILSKKENMETQFTTLKLTEQIFKFDNDLYQKYLNEYVFKFQKKICYRTAGFREKSIFLEHVQTIIMYILPSRSSFFRCFYVLESSVLSLQDIEIKLL